MRDNRIRHHLENFDAVQPAAAEAGAAPRPCAVGFPLAPGTTTVSNASRSARPTSAIPSAGLDDLTHHRAAAACGTMLASCS